jgi:hypothetical protein
MKPSHKSNLFIILEYKYGEADNQISVFHSINKIEGLSEECCNSGMKTDVLMLILALKAVHS